KLMDRVAIVTGGGSGIGAASALAFAREGARVLVADVDETGAKTTVEQIERQGGQAAAARADVARAADNQALVERAVAMWGQLDVFLANAGVPQWPTDIEDVDETVFDRIMAVNVKGVWLGAKSALPVMKRQRRGGFLITASTAATRPRRGGQTYSASKGAVGTLTKKPAREAAAPGGPVAAIPAAATQTPMLAPVASPRRSARGRRGRGRIRSGKAVGSCSAATRGADRAGEQRNFSSPSHRPLMSPAYRVKGMDENRADETVWGTGTRTGEARAGRDVVEVPASRTALGTSPTRARAAAVAPAPGR